MNRLARLARRALGVSAAVTPLLTVACTGLWYDDRCGVESRDALADARIRTADGDSMGYAFITLVEQRDADPQRSVSWYVVSRTLRSHVVSARLVASEDTSRLLLPLSGVPSADDGALEGDSIPYVGPPSIDELFLRARRNGLTIVLETDLGGRDPIVLPLGLSDFKDWDRPHCS